MLSLLTVIEAVGVEVLSLPLQLKRIKNKDKTTEVFRWLVLYIVFINWLVNMFLQFKKNFFLNLQINQYIYL
tara:strand:+ start:609 stop:824 length:216 start_codon:yes stop_codon:yes gene_type:complete